ncbi:MAG: hypothetical protein EXR79_10605 [Myxococcales bacterium]|nr:hypothetical protein [Myxococcales bacterium]
MSVSVLACSCIVPAPVGDVSAAGGPMLLINKAKTDPRLPGTFDWDPVANLGKVFSLDSIDKRNISRPLRYTWYWDYDSLSGQPLVLFTQSCSDEHCLVFLCEKTNKGAVDHRLLVVVSDGPLVEQPKGPLEFPAGTAFDAVEWQIRRKGACQ